MVVKKKKNIEEFYHERFYGKIPLFRRSHHNEKSLLDNLLIVMAGAWPAATLPQAMNVFWFQDASGVSFYTWFLYVWFTIPWIIYGITHKVRLITFAYTFNFILYSTVLIGIVMYG